MTPTSGEAEALPRHAERRPEAGRGGRPILLVHSGRDDLEGISSLLASTGHDVTAVAGPREALREAKERRFAVAVADLYMPEMNGVQFAAALEQACVETEVVLVAGAARGQKFTRCERYGVFAVLERPLDAGLLLTVVADAAAGSRLRRLAVAEAVGSEPPPDRPRVLVVEDQEDFRRVLCELLAGEGLEAVAAADNREALDRVSGEDFDVIMADFWACTGAEALRALHRASPDAALVVVSGDESGQAEAVARGLGATYIAKPMGLEDLRGALAKLDLRAAARRRGEREERRRRALRQAQRAAGADGQPFGLGGLAGPLAGTLAAVMRMLVP